ncbi:OsmC family protein [Flavobacterium sp. HNIBRBA15423]|uniref:OsmC family protein n=1 Tax=Flavobacterium sp. HNIBRBA15423 TaxID=3458683 RepID=UPI0040441572
MSTKTVTIYGRAKKDEQFLIKTENHDIRISKNKNHPDLDAPSPIEYLLAGYAGCVNAVGSLVAKELKIDYKSLQVDVSGDINVDKFYGRETDARAGFNKLKVIIKLDAEISKKQLENWLEIVESRCPVYDNLVNTTPIEVDLVSVHDTVSLV